jgi:hypothetical protein
MFCVLHYFYVIFRPHSFSHSFKFWTTTTPLYFSPSLPFFSVHSCHPFFVSLLKRPPAISVSTHTILFAPVTPPFVTKFARSVCFSVSFSWVWLCYLLTVCPSTLFRSPLWSVLPSPISRSVCLSNFFFNSFLKNKKIKTALPLPPTFLDLLWKSYFKQA